MPIEFFVTETKFFSQFYNEYDFSLNTTDFASNLAANLMEKVKVQATVQIGWFANASDSDEWLLESDGVLVTDPKSITRQSGNFRNDGFYVGDRFAYYSDWDNQTQETGDAEITAISPDGKRIIFTGTEPAVLGKLTNVGIRARNINTFIESGTLRYGILENSENFNFLSKISGNEQGYYHIELPPTFATRATPIGLFNDWVNNIDKSDASIIFEANPDLITGQFSFEHEFVIVPWYLQGQLADLTNGIPSDDLEGNNSYKYAWQLDLQSTLSDPNSIKSIIVDSILGSVGYFDENFNGFDSFYFLSDIVYQDAFTLDPLTSIDIASRTKITLTFDTIRPGGFVAGERVIAYFSYLPDADEYTNTDTTLPENFLYDFGIHDEGGPLGIGQSGVDVIKGVQSSIVAGQLVVEVFIEFSGAQQSRLTEDSSFILAMGMGDVTASNTTSDRVTVKCAVQQFIVGSPISGLINVSDYNFLVHDEVLGINAGNTTIAQWNEDGIVLEGAFSIDLSRDAVINTLKFETVSYDDVEETFFSLQDGLTLNVGDVPVSMGVQQIEIDTTRGYNLALGDQFNFIKVATANQVGNNQFYTFQIGFKLNWKEWVFNPDVDTEFFDNSEPNNNLNEKSSNYSDIQDYDIRFSLQASLTGLDQFNNPGVENFFYPGGEIIVYDYNEDGDAIPTWTGTIETFDPDTLADLNGAVLNGKNTLFQVTWVNKNGPVGSIAGGYAIHRIEAAGQLGFDIDELSTINPFPGNNRLIPLEGETQLKIEIVGGNVVTSCLIDFTKIQDGTPYNLSARLKL